MAGRDAEGPGADDRSPPGNPDPEAPLYSTVPLEDEEGEEYVIEQSVVGRQREVGGGEYPDPHTPPQPPAPGSVPERETGSVPERETGSDDG